MIGGFVLVLELGKKRCTNEPGEVDGQLSRLQPNGKCPSRRQRPFAATSRSSSTQVCDSTRYIRCPTLGHHLSRRHLVCRNAVLPRLNDYIIAVSGIVLAIAVVAVSSAGRASPQAAESPAGLSDLCRRSRGPRAARSRADQGRCSNAAWPTHSARWPMPPIACR